MPASAPDPVMAPLLQYSALNAVEPVPVVAVPLKLITGFPGVEDFGADGQTERQFVEQGGRKTKTPKPTVAAQGRIRIEALRMISSGPFSVCAPGRAHLLGGESPRAACSEASCKSSR